MNPNLLLAIPLLPLAGRAHRRPVRRGSSAAPGRTRVTIAGVAVSCVLSLYVLKQIYCDGVPTYNAPVYTWLVSDGIPCRSAS